MGFLGIALMLIMFLAMIAIIALIVSCVLAVLGVTVLTAAIHSFREKKAVGSSTAVPVLMMVGSGFLLVTPAISLAVSGGMMGYISTTTEFNPLAFLIMLILLGALGGGLLAIGIICRKKAVAKGKKGGVPITLIVVGSVLLSAPVLMGLGFTVGAHSGSVGGTSFPEESAEQSYQLIDTTQDGVDADELFL